jgi:hypothetical protein
MINCADGRRKRTENNLGYEWRFAKPRSSIFGSIFVGGEVESGEIYSKDVVPNVQFG